MSELITVPNFNFPQGKVGDTNWERPISVQYYNGGITLEQEGEFDVPETITIHPDHVKALFKAILKHQPEAINWLSNK